jgi:hypothetical protein
MICKECDGEMTIKADSRPIMLITGDVDTESKRIAICSICGHREIIKDE